jgi:hypothetical protein
MSVNEQSIIYELYKLASVILPEKADWTVDDLFNNIYKNSESKKPENLQNLKNVLKNLEQKQAVVFKDGFNSIDLIESKLRELTKSKSS